MDVTNRLSWQTNLLKERCGGPTKSVSGGIVTVDRKTHLNVARDSITLASVAEYHIWACRQMIVLVMRSRSRKVP